MTVEQVCNIIRDQNAPYIRVLDTNGKLLFSIEDGDNVETSVQKLQETLPVFESYGRVKVHAATPNKFKLQYKGCHHFDCILSNKTSGAVTVQPIQQSQSGSLLELVKVMQVLQVIGGSNNNNNAGLEAKLAAMEQKFEYEKKLMELERKNSDPTKYFAMFGPAAMRMAGMKAEDVKETLMLTQLSMSAANGAQQQPNRVSGAENTTLTTSIRSLEEIAKIPNEQKNKEIENLMFEIGKKIPAEHMLLILEIVNAKPELVEKVIKLHNENLI